MNRDFFPSSLDVEGSIVTDNAIITAHFYLLG